MPTKRSTQRAALTLRDIGIPGRLDFLVGWHPPVNAGARARSPRWTTYADYVREYAAVRDEFLARHPLHSDCFAEVLFQRIAVDHPCDVEAIGAALYAETFVSGGISS